MGLLKRLFGREKEEGPAEVGELLAESTAFEAPSSPEGGQPVLRVEVDRQACIGAGECLRFAPGVFALDEENIAIVVNPGAATRQQLIIAAEECPSQAIKLYDLDGTQVYPDWM